MILFKIFISTITLLFPMPTEGYRDRKGDAHPNSDWITRGIFCCISGLLVSFLWNQRTDLIIMDAIRFSFVSSLLFAALFPYYINWVHLKNKVTSYKTYRINNGKSWVYTYPYGTLTKKEIFDHVVGHLSDTAWPDKTWWWRRLGWKGRMIINSIILCIAIWLAI